MSILAVNAVDTLQWHLVSSGVAALGLISLGCWGASVWICAPPKLRYKADPKLPTQSPSRHQFYWNPVGWSFSGKQSVQFRLLFVLTVGVKASPSARTVAVYSQRDVDIVSPSCKKSQERHCPFIRERLHLPCHPLGRHSLCSWDPRGLLWINGVLKFIDL